MWPAVFEQSAAGIETGTPELECAESGINLNCKSCPHAHTGPTEGDKKMQSQGYKTCKLSRNEVERGTYIRGETKCLWLNRLKLKALEK